jgi:hypothetical protein
MNIIYSNPKVESGFCFSAEINDAEAIVDNMFYVNN